MSIRAFLDEHYRHFNAGTLQRAARSLTDFIDAGGKVFLTLAGAMSTAEALNLEAQNTGFLQAEM